MDSAVRKEQLNAAQAASQVQQAAARAAWQRQQQQQHANAPAPPSTPILPVPSPGTVSAEDRETATIASIVAHSLEAARRLPPGPLIEMIKQANSDAAFFNALAVHTIQIPSSQRTPASPMSADQGTVPSAGQTAVQHPTTTPEPSPPTQDPEANPPPPAPLPPPTDVPQQMSPAAAGAAPASGAHAPAPAPPASPSRPSSDDEQAPAPTDTGSVPAEKNDQTRMDIATSSATSSTASTLSTSSVEGAANAMVALTSTPSALGSAAQKQPPTPPQPRDSGTNDPSQLRNPPAAASAEARVADLLLYYRDLSDHVVREGTAGWNPGFTGVLTTEWQPEERRFTRPLSLLWLYDPTYALSRNDNQELPSHAKSLPLLPHWTFGVEGDGDCMPRSLTLGDVAGRMVTAPASKAIWDDVLQLARDPVWGKVLPQDKKKEDDALARYRRAFCDAPTSPMQPMEERLKLQMAKPKTMPPIEDVLAFANFVHAHSVRSASFDLMHPSWLWDRTYPRGVILLDGPPRRLQAQFENGPPSLDYEKPQDSHETCRTIVLGFLEGTRALIQFHDNGTAVEGHGDSTCGHTDVLLPAPNHLLWGPSHPLFPMEPAAWIPFSTREGVDHFITPYHRGLFGTRYSYAQYGPVQLSPFPRKPLFSAVPSGNGGPFHAAVYYGSVVSFAVGEGGSEHGQGVVVLTYVKQHHRQGREHLNALAQSAASATAVPDAVIAAFSAMPAHGPVPFLAIWPLLSDSSSNNDTTCWQRLAPYTALIRHVRSAEVTRVWKTSELGGLAAMKGEPVANLAHRIDLSTKPIELDNPAQPTLLRTVISQPYVQRQVDKFVRTAVPGNADAESDFLGCMRHQALNAFPITELLAARAALNCALPLAIAGCFEAATLPAPSSVVQSPHRQPVRQAATSALQRASAQAAAAAADAEMEDTASRTTSKKGRPRKPQPQRKTVAASAKLPNKPTTRTVKKVAPVSAPPAPPSPPPEPDSKLISPVVLRRLKALFMQLADPMQSESSAPLSATVWASWLTDLETPYSATLGGAALADALDSWKEVLWEQLRDLDAQLYQFLLEQALTNEAPDVERAVERLGSRGGATNAEWRRDYKPDYAPPGKNVKLLWAYNNGLQPQPGSSIWTMHCSGMWYGKRVNDGFKIKEPLSRRASESVTSSSTPNSSTKSKRKGKRASTSSVTTANKESDDSEQLEDGEAPSTQEPETEQEVMIVPPPSVKNKRQKLPPAVQPAAAASAEAVLLPRTPARSAARAASSAPTTSAVLATDSLGHPAAPATRSPAAPATRTGNPMVTAAASVTTPSPSVNVPSVSRAPLTTPMTAASGGSEVTAVTAVLQAMQAQQTSFLEAQARSEERAAASQRASEEAHREMLRLAQAGQKTVIDLVHSVAPFLRGGNANPHVATGPPSNSLRLHQPHQPHQHSQHQMLQLMPAAVPAHSWSPNRMHDIEEVDGEAQAQAGSMIAIGNRGNGMGIPLLGSNSSQQGQMMLQQQQQQMMQQQQLMMQQMLLMQTGGGRYNSPGPGQGRGGGRGRRPNLNHNNMYANNSGWEPS